MPPSYIRVRAVVWAYGRGQTDRQTHRRVWPQYILRRLRLMQNVITLCHSESTVNRMKHNILIDEQWQDNREREWIFPDLQFILQAAEWDCIVCELHRIHRSSGWCDAVLTQSRFLVSDPVVNNVGVQRSDGIDVFHHSKPAILASHKLNYCTFIHTLVFCQTCRVVTCFCL